MSSLPYELIALDLDMTLLNPQLEISPRNRVAVRRCRDLGVKAVISSGRMHASTLAYQRVLELDTPSSPITARSSNGRRPARFSCTGGWISRSLADRGGVRARGAAPELLPR